MRSPRFAFFRAHSILAAVLLGGLAMSVRAEAPKSLLPAFGNEGAEFTVKGQSGHETKGWLPTDWKDNSEWAAVDATYTKLTDSPDKDAGAVRIKITKVDEGQLQLTTYGGIQKYKKGSHYVVTGWVRSPDQVTVKVGARQMTEPYEFYQENDLPTSKEWKQFEFAFTPEMDFAAFLMFVIHDVGTVDLAGVTLVEKP
jgi:hypothetical protein